MCIFGKIASVACIRKPILLLILCLADGANAPFITLSGLCFLLPKFFVVWFYSCSLPVSSYLYPGWYLVCFWHGDLRCLGFWVFDHQIFKDRFLIRFSFVEDGCWSDFYQWVTTGSTDLFLIYQTCGCFTSCIWLTLGDQDLLGVFEALLVSYNPTWFGFLECF